MQRAQRPSISLFASALKKVTLPTVTFLVGDTKNRKEGQPGMGGAPQKDLEMLLASAQQGNTRDYHRGLMLLATPVRKYVTRILFRYNRQHLAEDVVQETMLAIHMKLHTYITTQPAMPWVYTIARYKTIDMLRRLKVKDVSLSDPVFEDTIGNDSDIRETEIHCDLNKLLESLEPPQGDIIRALKIEGISVAILAQQYGFSESKIKVMVHRGLHKLNILVTSADRGAP